MNYKKDCYGNRAEKCSDCYFCSKYIRSDTAANCLERIICSRYPTEIERPYNDWCGEFKHETKRSF